MRCVGREQPCEYFTQIQEYDIESEKEPSSSSTIVNDFVEGACDFADITPPPSVGPLAHTSAFYNASPVTISPSEDHHETVGCTTVQHTSEGYDDVTASITKDIFLFDQ